MSEFEKFLSDMAKRVTNLIIESPNLSSEQRIQLDNMRQEINSNLIKLDMDLINKNTEVSASNKIV